MFHLPSAFNSSPVLPPCLRRRFRNSKSFSQTWNNQYNLSSDLINKISTQIAKGAGGQEDVRVKELSFDKSDEKNLRAAGEQALGRFTGGYLDLTAPLVNGMYQSFVSRTGGGKGDTKFPIEDKNGNTNFICASSQQ